MPFYSNAILIDTSAAIALHNPTDQYHQEALAFFKTATDFLWIVLNLTRFETYTRARYDFGFTKATILYDYLTNEPILQLSFNENDEKSARDILNRYSEHAISFHDALCATIMKRIGIYRAFTFDKHFYIFGFEVFPGPVY